MKNILEYTLIGLAVVAGIIFAIGQAVEPWWIVYFWLAIVIISRLEIIGRKNS